MQLPQYNAPKTEKMRDASRDWKIMRLKMDNRGPTAFLGSLMVWPWMTMCVHRQNGLPPRPWRIRNHDSSVLFYCTEELCVSFSNFPHPCGLFNFPHGRCGMLNFSHVRKIQVNFPHGYWNFYSKRLEFLARARNSTQLSAPPVRNVEQSARVRKIRGICTVK